MVLEQDAAYFEIHVEMASEGSAEIKAGVATKKDRQFYAALKEAEGGMCYIFHPEREAELNWTDLNSREHSASISFTNSA